MKRERGAALIWAMLVLLLVGSTSAILWERSRTVLASAAFDRTRARAFAAAEGALAHARHALATDPDFAGATVDVGGIAATSKVERTATGWHVLATAAPGVRIEATLAPANGLPAVVEWSERAASRP